jgi:hypothetical protein
MADNGGPLNFRRGLDELQTGNKQSADSQTQRAQMITDLGQRYSDSVDKLARNISSGVQGVIQNMDSAEEMRMKRQLSMQQTDAYKRKVAHDEKFEPLEEARLKGEIEREDVLTKGAKLKLDTEKEEYAQKKAGKDASDRAIADSYNSSGAKKPPGWAKMSVAAQASYATAKNTESDRKLSNTGKVATIAETNAKIAESEVNRTGKIMELAHKSGPEAVVAMVKNPDIAVTQGIPEPQLKRTLENFGAYNKSAQAYGKGQALTARMFKIAGLETTGANGTVSQDDMGRFAEKMTGFWQSFDNIAGDPKQQELKSIMVEMMSGSAAAGGWKIQSDSDVKLAYERMGSEPNQPNWDEGKYYSTLASIVAGNGKVKGFFNTLNARSNASQEQLKVDLVAADGFQGVPMKEKAAALYMQQPASMRDPKSSSYISPDEFAKKSAQEMYNSTFGIDREKNAPNLVAPAHWQDGQALDLALRDPVESAKLVERANANAPTFAFSNPSNQAILAKVNADRRKAGSLVSSPAALAGVDPAKGSLPSTKLGEQVDPINGNPNAPMTFSQFMLGESPGFSVVPQPSGKAAAGATPVGKTAEKYQAGVVKKADLHPEWQDDVKAVFNMARGQQQ